MPNAEIARAEVRGISQEMEDIDQCIYRINDTINRMRDKGDDEGVEKQRLLLKNYKSYRKYLTVEADVRRRDLRNIELNFLEDNF